MTDLATLEEMVATFEKLKNAAGEAEKLRKLFEFRLQLLRERVKQ